jgi:membrane protein DedA with SNARE-associated domain
MSAREVAVYVLVAISSLLMISYTIHMFIGGLVSDRSEHTIMAVAVTLWACVIGALAWDVIRRRRSR